jgi:hypothetical protein
MNGFEVVAMELATAEHALRRAHKACVGCDEVKGHGMAQLLFAVAAERAGWGKTHSKEMSGPARNDEGQMSNDERNPKSQRRSEAIGFLGLVVLSGFVIGHLALLGVQTFGV